MTEVCLIVKQFFSFVAFLSLLFIDLSSSAAITGKFSLNGTDYVCKASNQTYRLDDTVLKIFGKHLKMKMDGHEVVFGNDNVTIFDASNSKNYLQKIPTTILQLFTKIREMHLVSINLSILDRSSFKSCINLEKIKFGNDEIRSISASVFEPCINLKVIEFIENPIGQIDDGAFIGLSNLQVLIMKGNKLAYINPDLLKPLIGINTLTITNNLIVKLHPDLLLNMKNLQFLNLYNNEITHISSLLFRNKPHLEKVNFSNNSIATIDRRLLESWPNNAELDLISNQCINRAFGRIGSDDLPMSDVVGDFKQCYQSDDDVLKVVELERFNIDDVTRGTDSVTKPSTNESLSESSSDESSFRTPIVVANVSSSSSESESNETSSTLTFAEVSSDDHDESSKAEANVSSSSSESASSTSFTAEGKKDVDSSMVHKKGNGSSNETSTATTVEGFINYDEGKSSKAHDENTDSESDDKAKSPDTTENNESSEDLNDSDFDFGESDKADFETKNKTSTEKNSEDEDMDVGHFSFFSSEENSNDRLNENVTEKNSTSTSTQDTTSLETPNASFNTTIEPSTTSLSMTKKRKSNKQKILPTTFTNAFTTTETTDTTNKPYLHSYEQADCRFYLSAKHEYTCVVRNARKTLKRINVNHIEGYTNDNVTVVFFRNSSLVNVPRVVIDDFPHIKSLSVEGCGIKTMDSELFEVCRNLQYLDISNNKIHRVLGDSLKMCPMLESVDLTNNPVEKIESNIFECNPKLNITLGALKIVSNP